MFFVLGSVQDVVRSVVQFLYNLLQVLKEALPG